MARRGVEGGLGWSGNISFGMRSGLGAASDMSGWTLPYFCVCVTLLVVVVKHCTEVCSIYIICRFLVIQETINVI